MADSDRRFYTHVVTDGILSLSSSFNSSITVGNGTSLTVTARGYSTLRTPASNFDLNNALIIPAIIHNITFCQLDNLHVATVVPSNLKLLVFLSKIFRSVVCDFSLFLQ